MKKPEKPPFLSTSRNLDDLMEELTEKGKFNEFFKIEDSEYPYFEKWKYKTKDWGIAIENIWALAKSARLNKKRIKILDTPSFTFSFFNPSFIQEYLHQFDLNLGGNLQGKSIIPTEDKNNYLISSIMEEAIASSQIEGAVTTRKVAKEMLEKNQTPINKSQQMILNNYNTMKWIVENKNLKLNKEVLLQIHKLITFDTLDNKLDEGSFRQHNNIHVMDETNEIFYTPPDNHLIEILIAHFVEIANQENTQGQFVHPILKGIMLHFLIGYIHPFIDGNGRTARALFYWYLIKKGYWLIEYMSISRIILKAKAQYARAYLHTEYDDNDLTYFFIYNLKCIDEALQDLKIYIDRKVKEKNVSVQLLRKHNFNERQNYILQELLKDSNQYFTAKQIETKFGISNQTARTDLLKLTEQKLLVQRNIGKLMTFFADENLERKINK